MDDIKKENINLKNNNNITQEIPEDNGDVTIHTMQEDLNALSGIFTKDDKQPVFKENIKKEESVEEKENVKESQYFNPFIDKKPPQNQERLADFANKKPLPSDNAPVKKNDEKPEKSGPSSKEIIWTVVIALVVAAFFLGGYYFWNVRKASQVSENAVKTPENPIVENTPEETIKVEPVSKYSTDKPNYLSIDTDNPSYENLKSLFIKTSSEIKDEGINVPVEFMITDSKNNPVSFSAFTVISKIKLSDAIMKNLSDKFSVFVYSDSGNNRLTLAIDTIDQTGMAVLLKTEEAKLLTDLSGLFLENMDVSKEKVVFKDNNFKGVNVRYFNIGGNPLNSIDYALIKNQLVISTSKNSMWVVADKMLNSGN